MKVKFWSEILVNYLNNFHPNIASTHSTSCLMQPNYQPRLQCTQLVEPKVSIRKVTVRKSTLTLKKKNHPYQYFRGGGEASREPAFPKPQAETWQRRRKYAQHVELWVTTWCFSVLEENQIRKQRIAPEETTAVKR